MGLNSRCLAIVAGVCLSFGVVQAETPTQKKIDEAVKIMQRAVKEAEQGAFVLGTGTCPNNHNHIDVSKMTAEQFCSTPEYSCRCL
jgi:hypothetical protein